MPGLFGPIRLECETSNIDLERLRSGLLPFAADHDPNGRLVGRILEARIGGGEVRMLAEVGTTETALGVLEEIDDGSRSGFSPAFLILGSEPIKKSDPDYDEDAIMGASITLWQPYEVSSTSIPRNPQALLKGVASMDTQTGMMEAPQLVSIDDPVSLSLSAGRVALRSGKGTRVQRRKLSEFFASFDDARAAGASQEQAAQSAREAAGLA